MSLALVLLQIFAFGATAGVLIEFLFTGVKSAVNGNLKLTSSSYLWMPLIYGFTTLLLYVIRQLVQWPYFLMAPLYVGVFYGVEASSGIAIKRLTAALQARWPQLHGGGVIPWEYEKSAWAPAGLVNFTYWPYWMILGLCFDPIASFFHRIAVFLAGP